MASVIARPNGSWEVRETVRTKAGPRSRTLATFRTLTDDASRRAVDRAQRPTTEDEIVRAARRAGAPVAGSDADRAAAELLQALDSGSRLSRRVERLVRTAIGGGDQVPDGVAAAAGWAAATPAQRGEALYDLLLLADAVPATDASRRRRRTAVTPFPRLDSGGQRG